MMQFSTSNRHGTHWRRPETAMWRAWRHGSDSVPVSNIHARNKIRECLCTVRGDAAMET
jgi:hypothetical protein